MQTVSLPPQNEVKTIQTLCFHDCKNDGTDTHKSIHFDGFICAKSESVRPQRARWENTDLSALEPNKKVQQQQQQPNICGKVAAIDSNHSIYYLNVSEN